MDTSKDESIFGGLLFSDARLGLEYAILKRGVLYAHCSGLGFAVMWDIPKLVELPGFVIMQDFFTGRDN